MLLSLAKELESLTFVKYCSLSMDLVYFMPSSEINDIAFNFENHHANTNTSRNNIRS